MASFVHPASGHPSAPLCPMKPPPRWKTAVLIWLAIYPSITLFMLLFGEHLLAIPIPLRTLAITLVLVPLMVFVLLPILQKLFAGWLRR